MNDTVLVIFGVTYVGMLLGKLPGLALDRTGVALLGAIALVATEQLSTEAAWTAVDVPTIALLFGLMVVSAQLRLGGFYTRVTRRIAEAPVAPDGLLALIVVVAGVLSAVLANDIVCLAMAPIVVEGCARRQLDPVPFLLGLACAANVGSAATLIGNPQNMLIGQVLGLSFTGYLVDGGVPAFLGLGVVWVVVRWRVAGRWQQATPVGIVVAPAFDAWQTAKGLAVLLAVMTIFLCTSWPREVVALAAAGVLLTSRRTATGSLLGLVDWQLLVLFMGLFIVNHAFLATGALSAVEQRLTAVGIDLARPGWLFATTVVLSNLVSNVPAVMLLLPLASHPLAGPILAVASTLAGNLVLVGSIANLIVVDQAARLGVHISWAEHARVGVPTTALTLALAALWFWVRAG